MEAFKEKKEEVEKREDRIGNFLKAKEDLEGILSKGGIQSNVVALDEQNGISVHLTSGTLVYSIGQLQENPEKYFQEQREAHQKCLRLLERILSKSIKKANSNKPSLFSIICWRILGKPVLVREMYKASVEIALYRLVETATALGNQFFRNFPEYIAAEKEKQEALLKHYLSTEQAQKEHAALLEQTEQIRGLCSLIWDAKDQHLAALGKYLD